VGTEEPGDALRVVTDDLQPPSPPTAAPSPLRAAEGRMIVLFDVLWCVGAVLVWGPPMALAAWIPLELWAVHPLLAAASLPAAYLAFLISLTVWLGALGALLPDEQPGTSRVFVDRAFFVFLLRWGLEKYVPRPLITHIQLLTGLRTLYFRLQGMTLSWSSHISPGAILTGPSLMKLGHLAYIGDFAHLSTHLSQGDKLVLAPVVIGDRTNIGAHCKIGPGCTVGSDVRMGALCDLAPGAEIGDGVELGPACQLGMGVKIGANSKIEPRTFLPSWTTVPPGEVWGGDPGGKIGDVRLTKGEQRRRDRRRGL
jgi:carbonic anhydrase/acetyltransferase-like protein (isoleucine patch superfamily)